MKIYRSSVRIASRRVGVVRKHSFVGGVVPNLSVQEAQAGVE
jgi:hypothetical protein